MHDDDDNDHDHDHDDDDHDIMIMTIITTIMMMIIIIMFPFTWLLRKIASVVSVNPIHPEPHMRNTHMMHTMGIFSNENIECCDVIRVTVAFNDHITKTTV